jgi:ABC-type branched-subunit amino acid transport system substrate-binding protein
VRAVALACCAAFALAAAGCDEEKKAGPGPESTTTAQPSGPIEAIPGGCADLQVGDEAADVIVQSDFPLQGSTRPWTVQANKAIVQVLEQHEWRGGDTRAALQPCDDATAVAGTTDKTKCSTNAAIARNTPEVVAVVGVPDTTCATVEAPDLSVAQGGSIPLVALASGACLTRDVGTCDSSKYRPSGEPSFARVVPNTLVQAAALAQYAQREGYERIYVLDDAGADGREFAEAFGNAAAELGVTVVGSSEWGEDAVPAMRKAAPARPDALVLAGEYDEDVLKAKVAALGPNSGNVALLASEGFRDPFVKPLQQAQGMVVASPFLPPQLLPEPGKEFVRELYKDERKRIEPQSAYAAQAAELVLRAMEESDGTRAGIRDALFGMKVEDGLIGDFEIDENGDAVGLPVALYRLQPGANAYLTITPPPDLVNAAAG